MKSREEKPLNELMRHPEKFRIDRADNPDTVTESGPVEIEISRELTSVPSGRRYAQIARFLNLVESGSSPDQALDQLGIPRTLEARRVFLHTLIEDQIERYSLPPKIRTKLLRSALNKALIASTISGDYQTMVKVAREMREDRELAIKERADIRLSVDREFLDRIFSQDQDGGPPEPDNENAD
ncbi:MAG: hypothetical protein V2G41_09735 [bacterium JZ-2024 1]